MHLACAIITLKEKHDNAKTCNITPLYLRGILWRVFIKYERSQQVAGTKEGGKAAAATNKSKYGSEFYKRIGAMGGKKGRTGGFYANRELASIAGQKGGRISRRTKKPATQGVSA